jgi:nucleotide-binding universal stress UspA family protein
VALHYERVLAIAGDLASRRALLERAEEWAELANAKLEVRLSLSERVLQERIGPGDLVVMPHPTSGGPALSAALEVVQRRHRPVLLASPAASTRSILAATDLSDPALPALDSAWDAAQRRHVPLTTLYCTRAALDAAEVPLPLSPFDLWTPWSLPKNGAGEAALERARAVLGIDENARSVVSRLSPVDAILDASEEMHADLVVVGRRTRSWWRRLLFGSTCEKVIRRVACSVLVVPLAERKSPHP